MIQKEITNSIIKSPQNYAAVYARISSKKDNNSISAQIDYGRKALSKRNLLEYNIYTDHISARTKAPHERSGFKRLLMDAEAGCFKTLIVYRLDRLVRNFNHWIQLKEKFKQLNVKIIFSDESQNPVDGSPYSEFIQNLTVMVAEMEPNTINLRASQGRKFRRQEGAYNAAKNAPFGYVRTAKDSSDENNTAKSAFIGEPIKLNFIKYLYLEFCKDIINEKSNDSTLNKASIDKLINNANELLNLVENRLKLSQPNFSSIVKKTDSHYDFFVSITTYINEKGIDFVKNEIKEIRFHYIINEKTKKKKNPGNINSTLRNSVYSGIMLLDPNNLCKGLKYTLINDTDVIYKESISEKSFIKTNNLKGVVPYLTFKTVYAYLIYEDLGKIDRSKDFLFKNKIKCSCNKKLTLIDNNYLHCGNGNCNKFIKDNLIEGILSEVISSVISKDRSALKTFIIEINNKINQIESNILFHTQKKFENIADYLSTDDSTTLDNLFIKQELLDSYKKSCSLYREKLSYVSKLYDIVNSSFKENIKKVNIDNYLSEYKKAVVNYILSNEDLFYPMFNEIIKEIKVTINEDISAPSGQLNIKYEYKA